MRYLITLLVIGVAVCEASTAGIRPVPASCATSPQHMKSVRTAGHTTRPIVARPETVRDIRVELALFGSGTHLADVTDRVAQLLRDEPAGFTARADWLHTDPAPGKNKSLLIRYRYHNQERLFLITGGNRASYEALIRDDNER